MAKRIRTINTESLQKTAKTGGCGECQTSCQSACKTSCTRLPSLSVISLHPSQSSSLSGSSIDITGNLSIILE